MRLTIPSVPAPVIIDAAPGRILIDAPLVTIRTRPDAELLFRAIVEAMFTAGWLDTGAGDAGGQSGPTDDGATDTGPTDGGDQHG